MAANFYAVRTFYKALAQGRPEKPDRFYDPDAVLLEERVQLIKAKSKPEAMRKAEKDAVEYAKRVKYTNPYNQNVILEYMELMEIYEIEHALQDKSEIYASSRIMSKKVSKSKIAHVYLSKKQPYDRSKRKKFVNKAYFNG